MGIWQNFFTVLTGTDTAATSQDVRTTGNATAHRMRRPAYSDFTAQIVVDKKLTYGVYHGQENGYKLSSSLAKKPIDLPIAYMGIPSFRCANEEKETRCNKIISDRMQQLLKIIKEANRDGTVWVYPRFDKNNRIIWEIIEDEKIQDIVRDIDTKEIIAIYSREVMRVTMSENIYQNVNRNRYFSKNIITEKVQPQVSGLRDRAGKNTIGIMPVPFANSADSTEIRGHSDYENIITHLKVYHDTALEMHQVLTKFRSKLIQTGSDFNSWLETNLAGDIGNLDLSALDFVFNTRDSEGREDKTQIIQAGDQVSGHLLALKNSFKNIVDGSEIPEIFWGTEVKGNHASASEQMESFVKYIKSKRNQYNESILTLVEKTYELETFAQITDAPASEELEIEWGTLSALSEKAKSEVFASFASAASSLIDKAGITKTQLYEMWKDINPGVTEMSEEDFIKGISDMASHRAFTQASYLDQLDAAGLSEEDFME